MFVQNSLSEEFYCKATQQIPETLRCAHITCFHGAPEPEMHFWRVREPYLTSVLAIAHTLFTTAKAQELFKSDEYTKFVETHKGRTFTYEDGDVMKAVVLHELYEALHTKSIAIIPRTMNAIACLNYIAEREPLVVRKRSLLDSAPKTELAALSSITAGFWSLLQVNTISVENARQTSRSPSNEDSCPLELDLSKTSGQTTKSTGKSQKSNCLPPNMATKIMNSLWKDTEITFRTSDKGSLLFLNCLSLPDEQVYASIVLAVGPLGNITVKLVKQEFDTLTAGQLHGFLEKHLSGSHWYSSFCLMETLTKRLLPLTELVSSAYIGNSEDKTLWSIIPLLKRSDPAKANLALLYTSQFNMIYFGIEDKSLPNGGADFYFYADVECKLSDVRKLLTNMTNTTFAGYKKEVVCSVKPEKGREDDRSIAQHLAHHLRTHRPGQQISLKDLLRWSETRDESILGGLESVEERFPFCHLISKPQMSDSDPKLNSPLAEGDPFPDGRQIPNLFWIRWEGSLRPEVRYILENGLPLRSSTPEVAQGKYFLHAILLKNQDVVETVILKGEGFKTITEPEKNYKYWSNRHGEQDGPLTDAISKAFALVYELRTCNDD